MKAIPGYISWLSSLSTGREFPIVVFAADVDFVTMGMVSLTSTNGQEVVVTMLTSEEFKVYNPSRIQKRINDELNRNDLRFVELLRAVNGAPIENFKKHQKVISSYQRLANDDGFLSKWRKKRLKSIIDKHRSIAVYADIFSSGNEAREVRRESIEEFEEKGGKIYRHKFD